MKSVKLKKALRPGSRETEIGIPDALTAATAIANQIELYTANMKDFKFIPDLEFVVLAT